MRILINHNERRKIDQSLGSNYPLAGFGQNSRKSTAPGSNTFGYKYALENNIFGLNYVLKSNISSSKNFSSALTV